MKKININELSNLRMTAGNEKRFSIVIHNGMVKEWVGIGWVDLRKATKTDKQKIPVVENTGE